MKKLVILPFLLIVISTNASKITKAFEALQVYNYFEAKRLFEKGYKKDTATCGYGLSVIYQRKDNPFHQPDSALKFILASEASFEKLDEKKRNKAFEVGVDQEEIWAQKERVSQLHFELTQKLATTAEFNKFLTIHPWYSKRKLALTIRDSLAFNDAEKTNTWQAYQEFVKLYPQALQVKAATQQYNYLFYRYKTKDSTVDQFQQFVEQYANNPYVAQAQDQVYALVTKDHKKDSYLNFVRKYPSNPNLNEAWKIIYKQSIKTNSSAEIAQFLKDYPDYPFRKDVQSAFALSNIEFYPFQIQGKWGFADSTQKVRIKPAYDWVEAFSEGLALVGKGDYSGYINKKGRVVIPINYDDGGTFKNGYAWVEKDGKYGLINTHGNLVLNLLYSDVGTFYQGVVPVQNQNGYALFNSQLKPVVDFQYQSISPLYNGWFLVEANGLFGVVDNVGRQVIPTQFNKITYSENAKQFLVSVDKLRGSLNEKGDTIIAFNPYEIGLPADNRVLVIGDKKYGYLNFKGDTVIPFKFLKSSKTANIASFNSGYAKAEVKGKIGLIDTTGKKVVPSIFEDVGQPGQLIPVKKKGKWGYATKKMSLAISYRYSWAGGFENNRALVSKNELWGFINAKAKSVLPIEYERIEANESGSYWVKKKGKWGLLNEDLNEILPVSLDRFEVWKADVVVLEKGVKRAYFNLSTKQFVFKQQGF